MLTHSSFHWIDRLRKVGMGHSLSYRLGAVDDFGQS